MFPFFCYSWCRLYLAGDSLTSVFARHHRQGRLLSLSVPGEADRYSEAEDLHGWRSLWETIGDPSVPTLSEVCVQLRPVEETYKELLGPVINALLGPHTAHTLRSLEVAMLHTTGRSMESEMEVAFSPWRLIAIPTLTSFALTGDLGYCCGPEHMDVLRGAVRGRISVHGFPASLNLGPLTGNMDALNIIAEEAPGMVRSAGMDCAWPQECHTVVERFFASQPKLRDVRFERSSFATTFDDVVALPLHSNSELQRLLIINIPLRYVCVNRICKGSACKAAY